MNQHHKLWTAKELIWLQSHRAGFCALFPFFHRGMKAIDNPPPANCAHRREKKLLEFGSGHFIP
jgi:hypothetical protein